MFQNNFLRTILLLALAIAVAVPLYANLFIHPAYETILTEKAEKGAAHFVSYLVRDLGLEGRVLDDGMLPPVTARQTRLLSTDAELVKFRIFSSSGKIIYSTVPDELGHLNDRPYFRNQVMAGQLYSKVVRRDDFTAERQTIQRDVVETYVPLMVEGDFAGAVETYYDISASLQELEGVSRRSTRLLWGISLSLLLAILLTLFRAQRSILGQKEAEQALQIANANLESRIVERTGQLEKVNEWLMTEIAEHKQARSEIDGILRSVPDGLLVVDGDGVMVLMNRTAKALLDVGVQDLIGLQLSALPDNSALVGKLQQILESASGPQSIDIDLSDCADPRYIRVNISPLTAPEGTCSGHVVLLRDVSEERLLDEMKREFLALVAHELHTPLTALIGYSELLSGQTSGSFSEEQKQVFAKHIHNSGLALARIVDDLQDIGRLEMGQTLSLYRSDFSLTELIRQRARQYGEGSKKHLLTLSLPEEPVMLCADENRIGQVLANLLNNAMKYSPKGGRVTISLKNGDRQCRVSVADEGIGMSEEQRARTFEKFYRSSPDNAAVKGTGLGMYISKHIIEGHGGEIWLHSQLGRGTVVHFTLPYSAGSASA